MMKHAGLMIAGAAAAVGLFFFARRANAGTVTDPRQEPVGDAPQPWGSSSISGADAGGVFSGVVPVSELPRGSGTNLTDLAKAVDPGSTHVLVAAATEHPLPAVNSYPSVAGMDSGRIKSFITEGLAQGAAIGASVKQVLDKGRSAYGLTDQQIREAGFGNLLS